MSKQIALSNPTFDYSQISEEAKGKLICYESELSRSRNRAAIELIKHGEILHGVQEVLADYSSGVFVAWLDSVGFSTSSAYRAITAYVDYGSFPNLGNLEVSAMYELTKNEAAKKKAMKLADKGTIVTHAMAKQLIESASPKPKPKPKPAPEPEPDEQDDEPEEGYDEPPWDDSPKKAKAKSGDDLGKCPNCAGTKWSDEGEGMACVKCHHPHGEPAGDVDKERVTTQRQKTVKTAEALLRAFDDLHTIMAKPEHTEAVNGCKQLLKLAKGWK